jgi:hypothetical protein
VEEWVVYLFWDSHLDNALVRTSCNACIGKVCNRTHNVLIRRNDGIWTWPCGEDIRSKEVEWVKSSQLLEF